ncbi:Steadiness box [Cynara cardunculus var. scolymus]|uniref:Steadiness box n=1 Tax=Cynara cardunculus var. scolymus TaxID=59895 RepID=A0A124SCN5_CYNCS|nr:Steadiness box [Cynara cardunculus var. scolymus]
MVSPSLVDIIDKAIFCNTVYALAYTDSDQKWLIRKHLLSLHQEFSSLYPKVGTFIHNDGTMVHLLKAEGYLNVSHLLPLVHVTIWVHEYYPHVAPMVQVTSDPTIPIRSNHPFVDPSGVTTSSYLYMWGPSGYDLLGLAYNLVKLFSLDHPFHFVSSPSISHPSYVSKMEGMDRLWWMLHYDMIALRESINDEVQNLTTLQAEMKVRVNITTDMIIGLDHEKTDLKQIVKEMTDETDVLISWLAVNKVNLSVAMGGKLEDAFECVDDDSKWALELLAEDKALEDSMYALDKALDDGVVASEAYFRQVRSLARDQVQESSSLSTGVRLVY